MASVTNVSAGKPKIGGAAYVAPLGSTLPTDATTSLNSAFKSLGYIADDGLTNSNTPSSSNIKAWGGDTVLTLYTEKTDTFKFKLIEVLNADVLAVVYGSDNVSGSVSAGITIRANSSEPAACAWVFDMIMTGNVLKRIVIPNGKITDLGDIVYKDDEAIGYDVTLTALPGDATAFGGDTHKEYIKQQASASSSS